MCSEAAGHDVLLDDPVGGSVDVVGIAYAAKTNGYLMLLHEEWFPPISDDPAPTATLQSGSPPADSPLSSGSSHSTTE